MDDRCCYCGTLVPSNEATYINVAATIKAVCIACDDKYYSYDTDEYAEVDFGGE